MRKTLTMATTITCSWCHEPNRIGQDPASTYCSCCGHRADVPRLACDCPLCRATWARPAGTAPVVDTANRYVVRRFSRHGHDYLDILRPPNGAMMPDEALVLAAWLVALADPAGQCFPAILRQVVGAPPPNATDSQ
jgi:hypothetical protein